MLGIYIWVDTVHSFRLRSSKPYFSADNMDVTAMREKFAKQYRVLDLYARFLEGDVIDKAEEAIRFHVDERSIQ